MDEDAPIKKRWRLLAWGGGAVILVPVRYVAAAGPMWWRVTHRSGDPEWHVAYQRSLAPLYRSTEFTNLMFAYRA